MGDIDQKETEQYLDWLSPTQREDYRAVEIEGQSVRGRADDRQVATSTVSTNVNRAKSRLREIAEQRTADTDNGQGGIL